MPELIIVATFSNRSEADLAKAQLELDGIHSMISADDAGGALPYLSIGDGGVKLLVNEEDLERASEVLA